MENIIGTLFGNWTVLERRPDKGKKTIYMCRCTCGIERMVRKHTLTDGTSKSCGCKKGEDKIERLVGKKFGKITFIGIIMLEKA